MAKKKAAPVEIVAILDRSGSMGMLVEDAIGGFNTFLKEQQALPGEALMTLVLFDTQYEVLYSTTPIKGVPELTRQTYLPAGMTAMNDAIGRALVALEARSPEKAVVCILTDGLENASREFDTAQVKAKIEAAQKRGWEVVYLAANQDAFATGASYGINPAATSNFVASGAGVRTATATLSAEVTRYRK